MKDDVQRKLCEGGVVTKERQRRIVVVKIVSLVLAVGSVGSCCAGLWRGNGWVVGLSLVALFIGGNVMGLVGDALCGRVSGEGFLPDLYVCPGCGEAKGRRSDCEEVRDGRHS